MNTTSPASATFIELAKKSGLVTEAKLKDLFGDDTPTDPSALATALIQAQVLTPYQAKQLAAGKFRGFFLGPYKMLKPLGQGGMGAVYLATHTGLERKVAVKVLTADKAKDKLNLERFQREARAAAALDHPNIVRLHDINQGAGVHFLVMEYVEGKDLQSFLAETGPLHYAQAVQYVAQAAAGLGHAHDKGFIHRDIKPANLMLTKEGGIKILDMGLARSFVDTKDDLTGLLAEGNIAGTVDFISPEQSMNGPLDERADIYSLGATFYALVTGHPPFGGSTAQKLMQHQMKEPPNVGKKLSGRVPQPLSDVMSKMMAKRPSDRYQSATDVIDALSPWLPASSTGNIAADPISVSDMTSSFMRPRSKSGSRNKPGDMPPVWKRPPVLIGAGIGLAVLIGGIALAVTLANGGRKGETVSGPPVTPPGNNSETPKPPSVVPGVNAPPRQTPAATAKFDVVNLTGVATAQAGGPLFMGFDRDKFDFDQPGPRTVFDVPFVLPDAAAGNNNLIALWCDKSDHTKALPKSVRVPVNAAAKQLHFLSGASAWGWIANSDGNEVPFGTTTVVVRLHYADGTTDETEWKNGEHFADFFSGERKRTDVPQSKFALATKSEGQVRYLTVRPKFPDKVIAAVEFAKGETDDITCPVVVAMTVERSTAADTAVGPQLIGGKYRTLPFGDRATCSAGGPLFMGYQHDKFDFESSGVQTVLDVPFNIPSSKEPSNNMLALHSKLAERTRKLPTEVSLPVNEPVKAFHFLGGVSAFGWPWGGFSNAPESGTPKGATSVVVRLHYADGKTEETEWKNGEHFADFFGRHDVSESEFAFMTRNKAQVRYLKIVPLRTGQTVARIEFVKGANDNTCPVLVAVTAEVGSGEATPPAPKPNDPPPAQPKPPAETAKRSAMPLDLAKLAVTPATFKNSTTVTKSDQSFDLVTNSADGSGRVIRLTSKDGSNTAAVKCLLPARAIHLLGYSESREANTSARLQAKVVLHYSGGASEVIELSAGELAATADAGAADERARVITLTPSKPGVIRSIEVTNAGTADVVLLAVNVVLPDGQK